MKTLSFPHVRLLLATLSLAAVTGCAYGAPDDAGDPALGEGAPAPSHAVSAAEAPISTGRPAAEVERGPWAAPGGPSGSDGGTESVTPRSAGGPRPDGLPGRDPVTVE